MDDIIERIRKLLAMANDDRGNEYEREQALRRAHSLLMKHGLSAGDVEARTRDKDDPRGNHDSDGWSMGWARDVCNTVAKLFMCTYYTGAKINATKVKHHFVGRRSNAVTAMYMAEYIVHSILKEGRRQFGHNLSPETRAFALGASAKLRERVDAIRKASVDDSGCTEKALVVMEDAESRANIAFLRESGIVLRYTNPRKSNVSRDAYQNGRNFGGSIGLDIQCAGPANLSLPGRS